MEKLYEFILSLGADIIGMADITAVPSENRRNLPYGIAFGIALTPGVARLIEKGVSVEYFNEYEELNEKLDNISVRIADFIKEKSYNAIAQTTSLASEQRRQTKTELSPGRVSVPHKTVAALSGLGWIGKSTLLITPQYGSAVRLTSVLTDAPVGAVKSEYECLCGDCRICSDACPGGAIKNIAWDITKDRDDLIDFAACRKTVKKRGEAIGKTHAACGICMEVCPHTRKYLYSVQ